MNQIGQANPIPNRGHMRLPDRHPEHHGMFWGGALIVFGVLFLLQHLDRLGQYRAWDFWPLLLIVGGLLPLTKPGHRFLGVLLAGFGGLALMSTLGLWNVGWSLVWPLAVIALGLHLIYMVLTAPRKESGKVRAKNGVLGTAVMGSKQDRIDSQDFRGGEVNAVMGSLELDLSQAEIEGKEAVLKAAVVMGSIEIRAAAHWRVEVQDNTVMGRVENRTHEPLQGVEEPKTLIIQANAVLGSIEIRN